MAYLQDHPAEKARVNVSPSSFITKRPFTPDLSDEELTDLFTATLR